MPTAEAHIAGQQIYTALGVPNNARLFVGNTDHQMSRYVLEGDRRLCRRGLYGKTPSPYYDFNNVPISGHDHAVWLVYAYTKIAGTGPFRSRRARRWHARWSDANPERVSHLVGKAGATEICRTPHRAASC